jgi:hypothetical protein
MVDYSKVKGFTQQKLASYILDEETEVWAGLYEITQTQIDPESNEWTKPVKARIVVEGKDLDDVSEQLSEIFYLYMEQVDWDLANDKEGLFLVGDELEQ